MAGSNYLKRYYDNLYDSYKRDPNAHKLRRLRRLHEQITGRPVPAGTLDEANKTFETLRGSAGPGALPPRRGRAAQTKTARGLSPAQSIIRKLMGGWRRQSIPQAVQSQRDAANRANEQRYQGALGLWGNMGQAERLRIGRSARMGKATARQSLVNRGLGSSTVIGPMLQRIQESANLGYLDVGERVARGKAGIMERREDIGPDIPAWQNLMRASGRYRKSV